MGHLQGLDDYLAEKYAISAFDTAVASGKPLALHLHGRRVLEGVVLENRKWDINLNIAAKGQEEIQKVQVNYLYPAELMESVKTLIKVDRKVESLNLEPILAPRKRYFVKNKTLFPLMKEREVLLFTLLDGDVLRGIVTDFSRYEITFSMKGGLPVTILRHSIYDLRNKKGRCFLKSFQDLHRDWEKSPLFIN